MRSKRRKILLPLVITFLVSSGFCAAVLFFQGTDVDFYVSAADKNALEPAAASRQKPAGAEALQTTSAHVGAQPAAGAVLGEYTTKFNTAVKSRHHNIAKASASVNGTIVKPGEIFSFNTTIGPTSPKRGYKKARVFVKGTKAFGFGGGVCQVSSTILNAVEDAGLKVTEQHHHSLPVHYVPKGKDAATAYGGVDFKFQNTLSYPVQINCKVNENKIHVQILAS